MQDSEMEDHPDDGVPSLVIGGGATLAGCHRRRSA
jgi:hypothetical protein